MDSNIFNVMSFHLGALVTTLLQFAVLPILKILVLCLFGLILANRHINVLPATSRQLLSKVKFLIMSFFSPPCSSAFVAFLYALSISLAVSFSGLQWKPAVGSFSGFSNVRSSVALRTVIVHASGDVIEASTSNGQTKETTHASITTLSAAVLQKRTTKKIELRRKMLVRKRKLRKKGKWPPSKMAKLKNV